MIDTKSIKLSNLAPLYVLCTKPYATNHMKS
jgi:hypothetical protein